jgi:hypothetical protein
MVGVLDILVAIVTAKVAGDELVLVVNAHPVGIGLDGDALTGKLGRHRIAVAVQRDAELLRCPLALDATDVVGHRIERTQVWLLGLEQIHRPLMRLAVNAHIGDGLKPDLGGRVHRAEVEEVLTVEEVLFDIADAVFHASFFVAFADGARRNVKAPMSGEIEIAGIEHRRFTDQPLEYGRLQIVDHQPGRTATEGSERVLVGGEEVLHGLRNREFDIHEAAVAQHHDEEGQPPASRAHADRAKRAPVELGAFAGGKGELEEGFPPGRANLAHIVLDDGEAASEAFFAQALEDLLRAVRIALQEANDAGFEWIEPAVPRRRLARAVLRAAHPLGHRLRMQAKGSCGLGDGQPLPLMAIPNLAVGFVIDHRVRPKAARSCPMRAPMSSAPRAPALTPSGGSRASTW